MKSLKLMYLPKPGLHHPARNTAVLRQKAPGNTRGPEQVPGKLTSLRLKEDQWVTMKAPQYHAVILRQDPLPAGVSQLHRVHQAGAILRPPGLPAAGAILHLQVQGHTPHLPDLPAAPGLRVEDHVLQAEALVPVVVEGSKT